MPAHTLVVAGYCPTRDDITVTFAEHGQSMQADIESFQVDDRKPPHPPDLAATSNHDCAGWRSAHPLCPFSSCAS